MDITYTPDKVDMQIIQKLQIEGRKALAEIAREINLSSAPCWRRVDALEKRGVILGYHAHIDPEKVGLGVVVFVSVTLDRKTTNDVYAFEDKIRKFPEVVECFEMSGRADYLLKVVTASNADFREFLVEKLLKVDEVNATESNFALKAVKSNSVLPIKIPSDADAPAEAKAEILPKITARKAVRRISR